MLVRRPGVRNGYDRWADQYDQTPSSLVALERRHTLTHLRPSPGERILDAGCGTGAHLESLRRAGAWTVGVDLSLGMLGVARRRSSGVAVVQADLDRGLPLREGNFDAVLSTLVSEHLADLSCFFAEIFHTLRQGGRLVLSAFHPALAAAGIEAKFERDGIEYRLGAEGYSVEEYLAQTRRAGFRVDRWREYCADESLVEEVPRAARYLGKPMLLIIEAVRPEVGETRRNESR